MSSIAVLGPGGVGGLIAAALGRAAPDRAHSAAGVDGAGGAEGAEGVIVVARPETVALIDREGIRVRSERLGDFTVHLRATAALDAAAVEVLIVAPKATALAPALERVHGNPPLVVPLLNGLDHMAVLRERFGSGRVAAGTIRVESDRPQPGVVVQTSPFLRIELAAAEVALRARLDRLAQTLDSAGIPVEVKESEPQILWSKLVRLCALALTTSAYDRPVGEIRSDRALRADLEGVIREAAAVAKADGARIDPAAALAELDEAHAGLGSSMQRDLAAGREPELDAIAGAVMRAGARYGVSTPTVNRLAARVAERAGTAPPSVTTRQ